jgi:hypothetical protein
MMSIVFDSEACRVMAGALDQAWAIFLRCGMLTTKNVDIAKSALSFGIMEAWQNGQRHPRRLAVDSVARVETHSDRLRRERDYMRKAADKETWNGRSALAE